MFHFVGPWEALCVPHVRLSVRVYATCLPRNSLCRCSLRSVDDLLRIFAEYISIFDYWREIYCFIVYMCISNTLILYFTNKLVTDE